MNEITKLFRYKSWDGLDDLVNGYYNCTLKESIGDAPAGSKWEQIVVDLENGHLELINGELVAHRFRIKIRIEGVDTD